VFIATGGAAVPLGAADIDLQRAVLRLSPTFERLVRQRRRDPRPIAIAVATAVAAAMIAAGIAIARDQRRARVPPVSGSAVQAVNGFAFELAQVPAGFTVRVGYEQPVDHPAVVGSQIEPLDDHAGDVAAGPSARLAYIVGDPAEGAFRVDVYRTGRTLDPALEAARYPHGRVRTVRGHQAVELPQLRPAGNDVRGAAGREMAERIWMERPGLLVRVLSYGLTDTLVERLVATMQFRPDRDGHMQPPRLKPPSNFRLDPGEPVVRDRVPMLAREFWVEVDGPVRDQFKGSDERLLVRSAREASAASVERLARRHACARETTVRGHHAWLYALTLKDAAPVTNCERAMGLALAWIEHDDVAIEVAGQGRAPLSEELLRRIADGLRPLDLQSLVEGP
jgi:hypothetical protein